jgi:hypothetical protein
MSNVLDSLSRFLLRTIQRFREAAMSAGEFTARSSPIWSPLKRSVRSFTYCLTSQDIRGLLFHAF